MIPQLTLSQTTAGALLRVRMEIPAGYTFEVPPFESEKVIVRLIPAQKALKNRMQEIEIPLPATTPSGKPVELEICDKAGARLGGGVVILEDAQEK